MVYVRYAVEGVTDEPVAEKLLLLVGLQPLHTLTAGGKGKLDQKIRGLNRAAVGMPWLVIRDVDRDDAASCVPELRSELLGGDALLEGMCFRLAVREVEAWLLADRESFANYFSIRRQLPAAPEEELDPKATIVTLCRGSGNRVVRQGMVPRAGSGRKVGPEYVALLRGYAQEAWDPQQARKESPSLDSAIRCLARIGDKRH